MKIYLQMGEISSAVQDEELIEHMRDVLLPFIKEVQVSENKFLERLKIGLSSQIIIQEIPYLGPKIPNGFRSI